MSKIKCLQCIITTGVNIKLVNGKVAINGDGEPPSPSSRIPIVCKPLVCKTINTDCQASGWLTCLDVPTAMNVALVDLWGQTLAMTGTYVTGRLLCNHHLFYIPWVLLSASATSIDAVM